MIGIYQQGGQAPQGSVTQEQVMQALEVVGGDDQEAAVKTAAGLLQMAGQDPTVGQIVKQLLSANEQQLAQQSPKLAKAAQTLKAVYNKVAKRRLGGALDYLNYLKYGGKASKKSKKGGLGCQLLKRR